MFGTTWTYVEGGENLRTIDDWYIRDSSPGRSEVERYHLRSVAIVDGTVKAVTSDAETKIIGNTRTEIC